MNCKGILEGENREGPSEEEEGGNKLSEVQEQLHGGPCWHLGCVPAGTQISCTALGLVPWCFSVPFPKQMRALASALQIGKNLV